MKLNTRVRSVYSFLVMAVLALGLQACGGGDSSDTTVDDVTISLASAARGYYEGFATIDVAAGELVISAPDFKAIFDEKEFNIAYIGTEKLLYKGTFTEVTATTFKADIRVYLSGYFLTTATISNGTIDEGVSLKGTITGTGDYANSIGDIELTYNNANTLAPPIYTTGVINLWVEIVTGNIGVEFNSTTNINFFTGPSLRPSELICDALGFDTTDMLYSQTGRIRKFLTSELTACTVSTLEGQQLNGYFTNFNGGAADDDTMLVIYSDDNYAYVELLVCANGTGVCF